MYGLGNINNTCGSQDNILDKGDVADCPNVDIYLFQHSKNPKTYLGLSHMSCVIVPLLFGLQQSSETRRAMVKTI